LASRNKRHHSVVWCKAHFNKLNGLDVTHRVSVWRTDRRTSAGIARIFAPGMHWPAESRLEMGNQNCRYESLSLFSFSIVAGYFEDLFSRHPLRYVILTSGTKYPRPLNLTLPPKDERTDGQSFP